LKPFERVKLQILDVFARRCTSLYPAFPDAAKFAHDESGDFLVPEVLALDPDGQTQMLIEAVIQQSPVLQVHILRTFSVPGAKLWHTPCVRCALSVSQCSKHPFK
jgi:hypothetical protein